jgi:hypothetical protein
MVFLGSPWHLPPAWGDIPTWITAIATVGLLAGALVTAVFAIRAFREQSKAVRDQATLLRNQSGQLTEQRKITPSRRKYSSSRRASSGNPSTNASRKPNSATEPRPHGYSSPR